MKLPGKLRGLLTSLKEEPPGKDPADCWAACRLCDTLWSILFSALRNNPSNWDGYLMHLSLSHFYSGKWSLIYIPRNNPNKTHWFAKMDFGAVLPYSVLRLLLGWVDVCSCLPRKSHISYTKKERWEKTLVTQCLLDVESLKPMYMLIQAVCKTGSTVI